MLITSKCENKTNIMTVAWIIPVSVNPPLICMSIRPERFSYKLISETREFVVNIPTIELVKQVLYCGRRSGKDCDKFSELSLTPEKAKKVNVPIIQECIAHLECIVNKMIETGDHVLILGKILEAYGIEGTFYELYDMSKFQPCLHIGKNCFVTSTKSIIEPKLG